MSYRIDLFENFKFNCPNVPQSRITKWRQISTFEIVVYMLDGSRFVYDDALQTCRYVPPRDERFEGLDEEEWRNEFAVQVRRRMRLKGLTQNRLAEKMLITDASMSNYMTCKRTPNAYIIHKFAAALECSIDELMDFSYLCD